MYFAILPIFGAKKHLQKDNNTVDYWSLELFVELYSFLKKKKKLRDYFVLGLFFLILFWDCSGF